MGETIFRYISDGFQSFIDGLWAWIGNHGTEIALILIVAWLVKKYGNQLVRRVFHRTIRADLYPTKIDRLKRIETIDGITGAILQVTVVIIAGLMIVSELGVNTTPLLASAGVLGIALGFGAQSLIKDLTSGIFIIIDNQYRVGDIVKLDGISGKVEAINIRTTVLRALDGTLYHVPNGTINTTANYTMSYGGIEEDLLFNNDVDITKLIMVIDRVGQNLNEDPKLSQKILEPPHFERIIGFSPQGVSVKVIGSTTPNDSWEIRGEFYKMLLKELKKSKIKLPTPQLAVATSKQSKP